MNYLVHHLKVFKRLFVLTYDATDDTEVVIKKQWLNNKIFPSKSTDGRHFYDQPINDLIK